MAETTATSHRKSKVISEEDHFKFLISCIRYCTNGKVNFEAVAEDCDIVTKAAAAKRLERLGKEHNFTFAGVNGASRDGGPVRADATPKPKAKPTPITKPIPTPKTTAKSNKAAGFKAINAEKDTPDNDDEEVPSPTPIPAKKKARTTTTTIPKKKATASTVASAAKAKGKAKAQGKRKADEMEVDGGEDVAESVEDEEGYVVVSGEKGDEVDEVDEDDEDEEEI